MTIAEKLNNPEATFTQAEIYEAFEELGDRYGFYRDDRLPPKGQVHETESLVVDGFEHLGVLVVRQRTIHDAMIGIPSRVDAILKDNFSPSQNTIYNATALAMAKELIVSPPGLVDDVLASTDSRNIGFFNAFAKEYQGWMDDKAEAARQKKSGADETETGSEFASTSETAEISSQPTPDGSLLPKPTLSSSTGSSSP